MNDTPEVLEEPPQRAGAPWMDPTIQGRIEWRDGDIVVSVPAKSGTTWTMNIVHQLRAGGDPDFADVYAEVPWLELLPSPHIAPEELVARFDAMPRDRRRAFKTHSAPGPLPYQRPAVDRDVKYVVVMRNPDEAVASLHPFIAAHSSAWFELWGLPREALVRSDVASFYSEVAEPLVRGAIFGFLAAWWPLRRQPNVLFMHFSDMKRDHEGSVRTIARFLDLEPTPEQWPAVLEYTSFPWMKANEHKFEIGTLGAVPILERGAMIRKGKSGAAHEDGVTPELSAEIARAGREVVRDEAALEWCYRGGALP